MLGARIGHRDDMSILKCQYQPPVAFTDWGAVTFASRSHVVADVAAVNQACFDEVED